MHWDIFCRVIDNYGDIGICWRLSADLAARGHQVRLWVDDQQALAWMAPGAIEGLWPNVQVLDWQQSQEPPVLATLPAADVWIEGFGCEIPEAFTAHFAGLLPGGQRAQPPQPQQDVQLPHHPQRPSQPGQQSGRPPLWINLEYLSAEAYVERCHGLPSPVMSGPARGWTKYFFYPGFTARTGGLLREPLVAQTTPERDPVACQAYLERLGVNWRGERLISLFCYAPALLPSLLDTLAQDSTPTLLLATHGKAQQAVQNWIANSGALAATPSQTPTSLTTVVAIAQLQIAYLPALSQTEFDALLRHCDLNFVRGEDSVVRAIWAGKPFVWNIYPQDGEAHAEKLAAFLGQLNFPPEIVALHHAWNDLLAPADAQRALNWLCTQNWDDWHKKAQETRATLLHLQDLTTALVDFVNKKQ